MCMDGNSIIAYARPDCPHKPRCWVYTKHPWTPIEIELKYALLRYIK